MPKIVDKTAKKNEILQAALTVFAQKGIAKTKMSEIAHVAGIGKGTIYEYFRSKNEVFTACFLFFMDQLNDLFAKRLYRVYDPFEKLKSYIQIWFEIFESDYRPFLEIIFDFWAEGIKHQNTTLEAHFKQLYHHNLTMIEALLEECILQEKIKAINPKVVASIILATLDGLLIQGLYKVSNSDPNEVVSVFEEVLWQGLSRP